MSATRRISVWTVWRSAASITMSLREHEFHAAAGGEDIRVNFSCCHRELIASRFELINFMELIGESMRIGEQPAELA